MMVAALSIVNPHGARRAATAQMQKKAGLERARLKVLAT
jgi:hypothetical protein